jgi:hypothetical protein
MEPARQSDAREALPVARIGFRSRLQNFIAPKNLSQAAQESEQCDGRHLWLRLGAV